jgi:hypothetical protein
VGGIRQHDSQQVGGGGRGVNLTVKTRRNQFGQQAAVVDVGVSQQDKSDIPGKELEGLRIQLVGLAAALEHAAIHQEFDLPGFDQVAGAGDLLGGTEEGNFHCCGTLGLFHFSIKKALTAKDAKVRKGKSEPLNIPA